MTSQTVIREMPSTPVVHSIDIVLDRTDQVLVAESLNGMLSFLKGVLTLALLHSIFFHRIFGNIQPLTREILDVTFVPSLPTKLILAIHRRSRSRTIDRHPS